MTKMHQLVFLEYGEFLDPARTRPRVCYSAYICYRQSVSPSVCPSVRHTVGLVKNGWLESCNFHCTVAPSLYFLRAG